MDANLSNEEHAKKSTIYLKIRRRTEDNKALIPSNINIQRRSTLHTRIEKPFDEAYNNSPRTRIAKMRAARQTPESKEGVPRPFSSMSPSSWRNNQKNFTFETQNRMRKEILSKVSSLCENERKNTHALLLKITNFKKSIDQHFSFISNFRSDPYSTFDNSLQNKSFKAPFHKGKTHTRQKENFLENN
ncbi:hypothetical protein SteCoe_37863 [Stentor coeruleus]|uniref:Uncharacterized protein n=1 Tax=Stentor coeruleus TaxID=5963 RepID=A0A1R2AM82_9CILI|nr:hypothetical protein SteCoe_37863 [Stentor coeruleus]